MYVCTYVILFIITTQHNMSAVNENECVFKDFTECSPDDEYSPVPLTVTRVTSAKKAAEKRKDNLYSIVDGNADNLRYHAKYTSKDHINRYLLKRKAEGQTDEATSTKRRTRASSTLFDFKKNCLICGEECDVEEDTKH